MSNLTEKRIERKKTTAEDFTPSWLVNQMLSKLTYYNKPAFKDPTKTFLDPSCGNGNILLQVLKQKLDNGHDPIQALSTIFGCDIMQDNINECRIRLLKVIHTRGIKLTIEHLRLVRSHIVCTPLEQYPNGSLDYLDLDESETFKDRTSTTKAEEALKKLLNGNFLESANIDDDPLPPEPKKKIVKEVKEKKKKSIEYKLKPLTQGSILDQFDDDPDFK